ncbi:hypothetical protein LSPH24S_04002 [Lysinibacillus sphaericus]
MSNRLLISNVTIVNDTDLPFKGDVFIANGRIMKVGNELIEQAEQYIDGKGKDWLLFPGYIDMHIHGSAGSDAMDATEQALHQISRSLVQEGVTGYLATTMTQAQASIEQALKTIAQFENDEDEATLLGVHVEAAICVTEASWCPTSRLYDFTINRAICLLAEIKSQPY